MNTGAIITITTMNALPATAAHAHYIWARRRIAYRPNTTMLIKIVSGSSGSLADSLTHPHERQIGSCKLMFAEVPT